LMSEVRGNTGTAPILPISPKDFEQDPLTWKKFPDVLKTVQTEVLTQEEKTYLDVLIRGENAELKEIVNKSSNTEELMTKIVEFVRSRASLLPVSIEKLPEDEKLESAMKKISAHKNLKVAVKTLLKKLQDLQKKPSDIANRKLRMDNIVVKKYILEIEGAQDFMEVVGYRVKETGGKKYLEIDAQINSSILSSAIHLLSEKLNDIESPEKEKSPLAEKPRISCAGGCGFFGDEKTDNMCSVCYKKKYDIKGSSPPKTSSASTFCTKGCGFFGLPKFKGMCSICYSKHGATRRKETKRRFRVALTKLSAVRRFQLATKHPQQKNKSKCWKCPRKVGITGIECRCGYIFCGEHRYASEHDCAYDFKKAHQKKLAKDNIKVTGKKLEKIDDGE